MIFPLTQPSKLILKNKHLFYQKKVIFSGNIKDTIPDSIHTLSTVVHTNMYNNWHMLKNIKKHKVYYNLFLKKDIILNANTLIYYWPKNKSEAYFQLQKILSILNKQSHIFIVGENCSGVKSAILKLKPWVTLKKIDTAKHCILTYGILLKNTYFKLKSFFNTYIWKNNIIRTLPGMFDYRGINIGSALLISTFTKNIQGKILDIGTGSGILTIALAQISKKIHPTLIDVNLTAILASKINLSFNKITGSVFSSDLYSDINSKKKFNIIISNPPLHNGIKISYHETINFIKQSINYLKPKGEIRFVTNSCLS
ncbi:MAG TPA: 16S rRNA (guanine(1207)-N(2))-methyltransferase RsmC [Buchnera sp. (in: enterobacteria)]|nr:16S rRNA (guanine(1207)-N(2))-methyltransferase RsmC [Buchnera sp. (in: enterobacteria)]